jgi:LysR family transcriptional regulator, benzoate and cis,cis-muconate-responsive activator of ben and cat genes
VQRTGVRFHEITNPLAQTGVSVNHRLDEQGVHVCNFVAIAQKVARKTF